MLEGMRALVDPARDPSLDDGAPRRLERRLSALLTCVAVVCVAVAAFWEIAAPILSGHYASNASMGIIADNMLRYRIAAPVWQYTEAAPDASLYYCHHPWGIFWTTTAFRAVLGRSDLVCRLPAAILSTLTPLLLSALGRALYRPIAGAAAALAFASTPVVLAFASFNALEVPVIAYGTAFLLGWVRHARGGKRRDLALALVAAVLALGADWPAYVLIGSVLMLELWRRRAHRLPLADAFVVGTACVVVLSAVAVGLAFWRLGKLDDLGASYGLRSARVPADGGHRAYWDALMFTPVGIGLCRVGPLAIALRALLRKSVLELAPLAPFAMAATQSLLFPQGAAIHVFWTQYFALGLALSVAAIVATVAAASAHALARRGRSAERAPWLAVGVAMLIAAPLARDAWPILGWAHRSGGRFDERGLFISSDAEAVAALRALGAELPADAHVGLHRSLHASWAHAYALGGRVVDVDAGLVARPDLGGLDALVVDARGLRPQEAQALLEAVDVTAIGPYLLARPGEPRLAGQRFVEHEPGVASWMFTGATEPIRELAGDPWHAWEVADHYGLGQPAPDVDPGSDAESLRVAHNAALAQGDPAEAARLERTLAQTFEPRADGLGFGVTLVGVRWVDGVKPRLGLLWRAEGPLRYGRGLSVVGRVARAPFASTTPRDRVERELSPPAFPPPTTWQRGYLYAVEVPLLARPGVEVLSVGVRGSAAPFVEIFRR